MAEGTQCCSDSRPQARTAFGTTEATPARDGQVPGVIYRRRGAVARASLLTGTSSSSCSRRHGRRQVVEIDRRGPPAVPARLQEWQLDPVRGDIWHVDFKQIDLKRGDRSQRAAQ